MDPYAADVTATGPRQAGAELEADTHGMVAAGALATTAIETVLGTIVLPAGGDWRIFGIWAQVVRATSTAAEAIAGHFRLNAVAGDITPNPSPSRYPLIGNGSFLGALNDVATVPLQIYPCDYVAPGKASIELIVGQSTTATVAPQAVMGILFGKTIPVARRFVYIDRVRANVTAAADTAVGTITLAEKATMITGICCMMCINGVLTTAEELIGRFRLASDDVKMAPADYPCSAAFHAGLGAQILQSVPVVPVFIPVNIPVPGGARMDCFIDLNTAVTTGAEVSIYLQYE